MLKRTNFFLSLYKRFSSLNADTKFIENLQQSTQGINLNNITEAISETPELCNYSPELWQKSHDILTQHGFHTDKFLSMIVNYPTLLTRRKENIIESLECWRGSQFGEKNVFELLIKYPQLLDFKDESILLNKIAFLKDYIGTRKFVWKLLMNSPNLIIDKINVTEPKIKYLNKTMRVDITEVIQSSVFSNTLEKIECRHIFLERLGMYKAKNPKSDPSEPSKNPKLSHIMDTSDKRFAIKVAFVTLGEYEVFEELFKNEKQRNDYDDDEEYDNDVNDER